MQIAFLNCLANLIPLSAKSNKKWGTQSPSAFLYKSQIDWEAAGEVAESAFIDEAMFGILRDDKAEPAAFWRMRAEKMAPELDALQNI